jgi:hypothetical protein
MKAITTKYLDATNTKPGRIKASCEGGNSVTVSFQYEGATLDEHARAARALVQILDWNRGQTITLYAGGTEHGYVFVIPDDSYTVVAS